MGLFDFISGQFIEIIEWQQRSEDDTMCWKFPHHDNSIKNGAKLIVREGQRALFLSQGQLPDQKMPDVVQVDTKDGTQPTFIGDSFGPGTYTLETKNLPILNVIKGWKYGFESPFKADVYYVSTRRFQNLKWGTANPFMIRDKEFGPVRVRAFGTYGVQISDPVKFLRTVVSTDPSFETYEIKTQLRSLIITRFTDAVAQSGIPVLDMAANLNEFSQWVREHITADFEEMGLSVPIFLVENISLPPNLEEVLDKRASMGILGNLDQYTKLQTADAIRDAANNPGAGGGMGMGMGMGAGLAMGQQMAGAMNPTNQQPAAGGPPPLPQADPWYAGINGQSVGPLDEGSLRLKIQAGEIARDTLVWKNGMDGWKKAGDVSELSNAFGAVPPPLPPG